jgi:hypothetical protein
MIEMIINERELRRALSDIEEAKARGFMFCEAVLQLKRAGESVEDCKLKYSDLVLKAHPIDPNLNWGRGEFRNCRFVEGELVDD